MHYPKKKSLYIGLPLLIFSSLLLCAISCAKNEQAITGTWASTSISNEAPLFKKTLPDRRPGVVIFTLRPAGTFTWRHKDEKQVIKGSYILTGDELQLMTEKEETISVKVKMTADRLSLLTGDGFTFRFKKTFGDIK